MANELTGNPWKIDTAAVTTVIADKVYVKSVRWVFEAAVAGDNAVIQEVGTSRVLWESVAAGANYGEEAMIETWWPKGFKVPTLAGGILYITYG